MKQWHPKRYYILCDFLSGIVVWYLLYRFRKLVVEPQKFGTIPEMAYTENFFWGLFLVPLFWVFLFGFFGAYYDVYRRTKTLELSQTLGITILGVLIIFFTILINDEIATYKNYFEVLWFFLPIQFFFTLFFKFSIVSITLKKIAEGTVFFKTIIVGAGDRTINLLKDLEQTKEIRAFQFVGVVEVEDKGESEQFNFNGLEKIGAVEQLDGLIKQHNPDEIFIALEPSEHAKLESILNEIQDPEIKVKIVPDMYSIVAGQVKTTNIFGAPLIEVKRGLMQPWELNAKRLMDVLLSLISLVILMPVLLGVALWIKFDSKGPIFYLQERIGKNGEPFFIIKFRTMFMDAEANGPMLSNSKDTRITGAGRFLRKTRLDEVPNFINVLKGEMSLVGPRPERAYYAEQLVKLAPHYKNLTRVRPGITSWGQVKYGYAENVEQMLQRLKFDLIYIENMSLLIDLKILFYTLLTVIRLEGK
ncbi:MAG: sugar transferase [Luteibaculaceae bacterium]